MQLDCLLTMKLYMNYEKKILLMIVIATTSCITFTSCNNSNTTKNRILNDSIAKREAFVKDSIAKREAFVKDSIESIEAAKRAEFVNKNKSKFREKVDEFQNVTWIYHKSSPQYTNRNACYFYFYIKDGKASNFRFRFQYYDDDWLFIKNMIFRIDDENITISPDMERDNNSDIWEWCDVHFSEVGIPFITKMANANSVKVRLNGRQYYDTRTLTKEQIKAMKETLEYYYALGGAL